VVKAVLALLVLWACVAASASADCKIHRGDHVVLYSTTDDPSVLVWDSRERLRDYHAASFDAAQAMLPHALLVAPGTHANVISCIPSYVTSPAFAQPQDAIGVVISSGPQHGLARWVLGSDVQLAQKQHH
jgi:hypothetical protein